MTDDLTSENAPTTSGLSRRSLVRAGATVAWTTPVIVAATAAPALAVTGDPSVSTALGTLTRNPVTATVPVSATFTNANTVGSTTFSVTEVITVSAGASSSVSAALPAGYTLTSSTNTSSTVQTNIYSATVQIGGSASGTATKAFSHTITLGNALNAANAAVTVMVTPSPTPGAGTGDVKTSN